MRMSRWLAPLSRLNVLALLIDQFRYLTNISTNRPEWAVRLIVLIVGPAAFVVSFTLEFRMQTVGELVGALGLLAGVFISAFALVFSLRVNMATKPTLVLERRTARLMDESALTLLSAGLLAGVTAMWLAGVSVALPPEGYVVSRFATAMSVGLGALVAVYFLLSVRRLHKLYTDTFLPLWKVRDAVHGPKATPGSAKPNDVARQVDARRNS